MGVPVVTLKGDRFIAHQGESLLHAAGLPEWIASGEEEYVALALAAAAVPDKLAAMRAGLRAQAGAVPALRRPPVRTAISRTRGRSMWSEWCARQGAAG